jgi:hypothetical protein
MPDGCVISARPAHWPDGTRLWAVMDESTMLREVSSPVNQFSPATVDC